MTDLTVRVSGGFNTDYESMSDSLRARIAAADVDYERQAEREERARQVRAAAAEENAVRASIELAQARGELVDVRQAYRDGGIGRTRGEAVAYYSAVQDLEDARRQAEQERAIRQLAIQAGLLDVSEAEPSERAVKVAAEVAVRTAPADEPFDPQAAARGIRGKWLRRNYQVME